MCLCGVSGGGGCGFVSPNDITRSASNFSLRIISSPSLLLSESSQSGLLIPLIQSRR